jgi:hypothetical protein
VLFVVSRNETIVLNVEDDPPQVFSDNIGGSRAGLLNMDDNVVAFDAPSAGIAIGIMPDEATRHRVIRAKSQSGTDVDTATWMRRCI